jgi:ABC-type multidrug transport system ATPase subunit
MKKEIYLRWRGRTTGPFTLAEIRQALEDNEIGRFHEAQIDGRQVSLDSLLQTGSESPRPDAPSPATDPRSTSESPTFPAAPPDPSQGHLLRWRSQEFGPFTVREIERMLDDQEIGQFHEIQHDQEWMPLPSFFVRRSLPAKQPSAAGSQSPLPDGFSPLSPEKPGAHISVSRLCKDVGKGARKIRILNDISLSIEPNEFVAIIGPSGSGKSTLLDAISGRRPADSGNVFFNGRDLYENFNAFRNKIGCVPQKDIVHLPLTVRQEISFAARLRRPEGFNDSPLNDQVDRVIEKLGLSERADTQNANLSGGQIKRVSLGVEVIADPSLLFLDEATSGLDACTEARMMGIFRQLANEGRTVVCITHNLENVQLCDLVAILHEGRLVYYGPPEQVASYFGLNNINQVYDLLEQRPALEWSAQFETSELHMEFVEQRHATSAQPPPYGADSHSLPPADGYFRQLGILFQRYVTVIAQDLKNVALLFAQAPIIAILLSLAFGESGEESSVGAPRQMTLGFLMAVSAIWFGCINSAREIVKELPVYLRERAINLRIDAYFSSKALALSILGAIQCGCLILVVRLMTGHAFDLPAQFLILTATVMAGTTLGLLVSSLVNSGDKAMAIIPVILIPQVVFAGAITRLEDLSEGVAEWCVVAYWSFDAMLHTLPATDFTGRFSLAENMTNIALMMLLTAFFACYVLRRKDWLN